VQIFTFASRSIENIQRGFEAQTWAVATVSSSAMKGRITKAEKYFAIGSQGILYCSPTQSFTVPFIVKTKANPHRVVKDIWPEPWVLPFEIQPLGNPTKQLHRDTAEKRWPFLRRGVLLKGSVSAAMNFTGSTVFVPVELSDEDWQIILEDLSVT
jgi:hypothetical protein